MKYSSLQQVQDGDDEKSIDQSGLTIKTNGTSSGTPGWVLLLSMMGFSMMVAAFSLHDNAVPPKLRVSSVPSTSSTPSTNQSIYVWNDDHNDHNDLDIDVYQEVDFLEPVFENDPWEDSEDSAEVTYDVMEEEFAEHLDGDEEWMEDDDNLYDSNQSEDTIVSSNDNLNSQASISEDNDSSLSISENSQEEDDELDVDIDNDIDIEDVTTVERMEDEQHFGN